MLNLEIALYFENYMVHQKRGYLWGMWLRNQSRSSLMAKISARADYFPIGKYSTYMLVRTIRAVRKRNYRLAPVLDPGFTLSARAAFSSAIRVMSCSMKGMASKGG